MPSKNDKYLPLEIPFKEYAKLPKMLELLVLFCILIFLFFLYLIITVDGPKNLTAFAITLVFLSWFVFFFLYFGILKKAYIEITEDYIKTNNLFISKTALWSDINNIQMYERSGNLMLGIILKEGLSRKSAWRTLNKFFGDPYSIRISLTIFQRINKDRLWVLLERKLPKD